VIDLMRAAVMAALFVCAMLLPTVASAKPRVDQLTIETASGPKVFQVEVAENDEDKMVGLMYRTSVPDGTGMLFPYGRPQEITMWMKNTYVSLDMVFIKADGTVLRVAERTEPLSERTISSQGPAAAVLELVGGAAARLDIKPGDKVRHKLFGTAK
jgi:uncharacterized membrane protein (UPF0127 family)